MKHSVDSYLRHLIRKARYRTAEVRRGECNVCGSGRVFYCPDGLGLRESAICVQCGSTSRYRSIAKGLLRAIQSLRGVGAKSLAELPQRNDVEPLNLLDTQTPFQAARCAYIIPRILNRIQWVQCHCIRYPAPPAASRSRARRQHDPMWSVQSLERLGFANESLDLVVTSDVMEHVRLDREAHQEIARTLRDGGVYLFTVPHSRGMAKTLRRVVVHDALRPELDEHVLPAEFHGDTGSRGSTSLAYRVYGRDLDEELQKLGLHTAYEFENDGQIAIFDSELFYCTRIARRELTEA